MLWLLGALLWWFVGATGSVWVIVCTEPRDDLRVDDLGYVAVFGLFGPLAWVLGLQFKYRHTVLLRAKR